jgi:DNA polymerase
VTRKPARATIDFETRSTISLKKHGTWRYARHPKTQVMCLVFRLPHWEAKRTAVWHPAYPKLGILKPVFDAAELQELFDWIAAGRLIEAHNAWFERCIWQHIMVVRYGFPRVPAHVWRCSAAQAAAVALPRGLDDALAAIALSIRKDATGSKVM